MWKQNPERKQNSRKKRSHGRKRRRGERNTRFLNKEEDSSSEDSNSYEVDLDKDGVTRVNQNTIYFYGKVTQAKVMRFNHTLSIMAASLQRKMVQGRTPPDTIIQVNIFSDGGDLAAGMSAADHISTCQVPVRTIADGECCSAGTLMSVAASERALIMPAATMLVHQLSGGVFGTKHEIVEEVQNNEMLDELMQQHYMRHCPRLEHAKLKEMLANELCLNAASAVELGLCDGIVDGSELPTGTWWWGEW